MTSPPSVQPMSRDGPSDSGKRHSDHGVRSDRHGRLVNTAGSPRSGLAASSSLSESRDHYTLKSPSRHRPPPPPVGPYMHHPHSSSDRSTQSPSKAATESPTPSSLGRLSGNRDPSVPPPQRPNPAHIPSPPSPRQSFPSSHAPLLADRLHASPTGSEHLPVLSPPPSRGPDSQHARTLPLPSIQQQSSSGSSQMRPHSPESSRASGFSTSPLRREASQSHSGESDDDGESAHADAASEATPTGGGPALQRPKRTRVLMTHMQQQRLGALWKRAKFPTTQEREEIAVEVGLTPRQVQVWFQNRRQTFRKQIQQNSVPHGSDPADYSDLQKSPRSRRLSLEAANAVILEDRDRVSAWASSSGSAGAYPPRMYSMGDKDRPVTVHTVPYSRSPPSPRRMYDADYGHPHAHWRGAEPFYRPATAAPSPSLHGSMSYPGPQPHHGGGGGPFAHYPSPVLERRRSSLWDYRASYAHSSHSTTGRSPGPHSPPPTAESGHLPHLPSYASDSMSDGSNKRPRVHDPEERGDVRLYGAKRLSPERRPSHLPPSLAAIAISRPLDRVGTPRSETTLPSLSASLDSARIPPRTTSPWRPHEVRVSNDYNDPIDAQRHSPRSAVLGHSPRVPNHPDPNPRDDRPRGVQVADGVPARPPSSLETVGRSSSASSLPRFNELFR